MIAPVLTFAAYSTMAKRSGNHTTLDASRIFTSLSLFALLQQPLGSLVMSLATFMGAVGSFARIQAFLDAEPHQDLREGPLATTPSLKSMSFIKGIASKTTSTLGSTDCEKTDVFTKIREIYPEPPREPLRVRYGSFGWGEEEELTVRGVNLVIPPGRLTIVVGPVGCGKSTLLKALLGEVPVAKGNVSVPFSSIGYCDQTPWHMNGTIRDSIIRFSEFDQQWYDTVIRACALGADLSQMPHGDQTMIGTKGIVLSGGQSQRVVSTSHHSSCLKAC